MKSSYANNRYSNIFKTICFLQKPKTILEFGILEGYSLHAFASACSKETKIYAYDLFDEFPYNAAEYEGIKNKFSSFENVKIEKKNFYDSCNDFEDNSIDIIHVDIANNGDVFKFVFDNYMRKLSPNGVCILEGGSSERDNVDWMDLFGKPKIVPVLKEYKEKFDIQVLDDYPSITMVKRR